MNDEQEKIKGKRDHVHERIKRMSKEEKVAEFRQYLASGDLLKVDVDQILADQAAVGAPDSALDDALLKIADLVGGMFGEPLTAPEMAELLDEQRPAIRQWLRRNGAQGLRTHEPAFSLRRRP